MGVLFSPGYMEKHELCSVHLHCSFSMKDMTEENVDELADEYRFHKGWSKYWDSTEPTEFICGLSKLWLEVGPLLLKSGLSNGGYMPKVLHSERGLLHCITSEFLKAFTFLYVSC